MKRFTCLLPLLALATVWTDAPARAGGTESCGQPMATPVVFREFSQDFGHRGRGGHAGIDLVAPAGTPVRAALGGVVVHVGRWYGYGTMVDVAHPDGVLTRYAHLSSVAPGIRVGSLVRANDQLGGVGRTGRASTNHLHFEVRVDGRPVDPKPFLGWAASANCPPSRERLEEAFAGGARWNARGPRPF